MTTPIRNSCVARGVVGVTAGTVLYTVPTGYVLLLKDVRLYNTTGTTTVFRLQLNAPGVTLIDILDATLNSGGLGGYSGWCCLNAGDQVFSQQSAAVNVEYWISGALLPHVP